MKYRKLRIAWSAFFGIFCLLLISLWMRSYWWYDYVHGCFFEERADNAAEWGTWQGLQGDSWCGLITANWTTHSLESNDRGETWQLESKYLPRYLRDQPWQWLSREPGYRLQVQMPHWVLVALILSFAIIPWLNRFGWRFSLRTLLIAMTLVAALLGLIVVVAR